MSPPLAVPKRLCKQPLLLDYFADVHSVIDIAVFGALVTGLTSVQIYYGSRMVNQLLGLEEDTQSLGGQVTAIREKMATKKDLENLSDELAKGICNRNSE